MTEPAEQTTTTGAPATDENTDHSKDDNTDDTRDGSGGGSGVSLPAPERRGRLTVDQSVVRKVAEHTADLTPGTARSRRRIAGLGVGERGASATVRGTGNQVELALDLALHYPAAVRAVVADIRTRIIDEVGKTTGYQVRSFDITVSALLPDTPPRVR